MMKIRRILLRVPLFSHSTQVKISFWAPHAGESCEGLRSEICVLRVADTVSASYLEFETFYMTTLLKYVS